MNIEEVKKLLKENFSQMEEAKNKIIDNKLEEAYKKKEESLTENIKEKTRYFKKLLLESGFKEAEHYIESRLWKWKFYKPTTEDVAFIVNLEPYDDYIEIYYGYTSTAFTKMNGDAEALKKYGVYSDDITVRNMIKHTNGESTSLCKDTILSFYNKYFHITKDELLALAKEKRKEFINNIHLELKPLGFKKKSNVWTISLNEHYSLSFYVQKSRFCDSYEFYYVVDNLQNQHPYYRCHQNNIGYEYKNESVRYNWQCYSKLEFDKFFDFIKHDVLLPIINTDISKLKDLLVQLNSLNAPRLFIPTKENIKFYYMFSCELNGCTSCYKNN